MTVIRWAVVKDGGGRAPVAKPTGTRDANQQGRTTCLHEAILNRGPGEERLERWIFAQW